MFQIESYVPGRISEMETESLVTIYRDLIENVNANKCAYFEQERIKQMFQKTGEFLKLKLPHNFYIYIYFLISYFVKGVKKEEKREVSC